MADISRSHFPDSSHSSGRSGNNRPFRKTGGGSSSGPAGRKGRLPSRHPGDSVLHVEPEAVLDAADGMRDTIDDRCPETESLGGLDRGTFEQPVA